MVAYHINLGHFDYIGSASAPAYNRGGGHLILQSGETDGYCMLAGYGRKVYHIEQYDNRLYLNSIEHETRLLRSEGHII